MREKRSAAKKVLLYFVLFLFLFFVGIPLYWMVVGSFQAQADMYSANPSLLPAHLTVENYVNLFGTAKILTWFANSVIVSVGSIALGLFICTLTGYLFTVYEFRFKRLLFWLILASVTIPEIVLIIPTYRILIDVKLINTYLSLVLPYGMNIFGIFFMKQFIQMAVPRELIDSARVDGAGEFFIFSRIAVPLSVTGIGVLSVYLWLNSWINYFWPLIMIRSGELFTLPLGLATLYADKFNTDYGQMLAGSVLATIPLIALFLFIQDTFIAGMTSGAVKD